MKFNLKNYLLTGALLASSLLGYSQDTLKTDEKTSFVDSVMTEAEKYPLTTHFMYEIMKDSEFNFHEVNKLEKIIENVEKQHEKKDNYSKEEVIEILKTTDKEIKNLRLKFEEREFDCDDLSLIYVAVGEKFNLHLYCIYAPSHMFVRRDSNLVHNPLDTDDLVNKGDFNWETTGVVGIYSDKYFKNWLNISEESIKNKVYMKNLTKQELIAIGYLKRGVDFLHKKKPKAAIKNYTLSIKLNPNLPIAYENRGASFCDVGEYDLSIEDYNKAIKLDPNYSTAYRNRGRTFYHKADYGLAILDFNKAIELNPYDLISYDLRGDLYKFLGKIEEANADFKKSEELKNLQETEEILGPEQFLQKMGLK